MVGRKRIVKGLTLRKKAGGPSSLRKIPAARQRHTLQSKGNIIDFAKYYTIFLNIINKVVKEHEDLPGY